jgi:cystathionine gamma-synthase
MKLETLCVHAGGAPDQATGAVAPPIHLSTTFERDVDGEYRRGFKYARDLNPNRQALEAALAAIEGGAAALAFASGQAATAAVFQALRPGDHVVLPESVYYGTPRLAREVFGPWGLQSTAVDMRDVDAVAAALRPGTRVVWIETPSNPLLAITDIARVAALAHDTGALVVVDNTWATPVAQRPIALGADLVMHASTKYFGGHSDVMGGALVTRADDDFFARLRLIQQAGGAVASPFDSWLVLRGLRTLPWRVRGQSANALAVARYLADHPRVEAVHYPGLPTHPGAEIVARQMRVPGGMASVQVRGGAKEAMAVVSRVKLFTRATSLGGTESLIEHRASVEGPSSRTPPNLLRLSIGLEHPDDLIADLAQALG